MRILAGKWGGRAIGRPKSTSVRPMTDKVRAALFNIIGSVDGWVVLDAYAGSGAVGLEALSRGAASVVALEASPSVARVAEQNAASLGLKIGTKAEYYVGTFKVEDWVKRAKKQYLYHLIVADPPYEAIDSSVLERMAEYLDQDGLLVVSHSSRIEPPALESLELVSSRKYGDSALSFYKP